ncbi:hypothetical protein D3C81_974040 [compost metagenome]
MTWLQVFTRAGIENHQVERAPAAFNVRGNIGDLLRVTDVAYSQQCLLGKLGGQRRQVLGLPATQRNLVPLFKQLLRQRGADAAAGTCQPTAAHASRPLSQRTALPTTGTCS